MPQTSILPINRKAEAAKKRLGAYYTPQDLTDLMASWAITKRTDKVLEPSFGGCSFLRSCVERFVELGNSKSNAALYGCDIDKSAFNHLAKMAGGPVDVSNFSLGNFLTLKKPKKWPENFDVIIGNPPYVPYQKISHRVRKTALEAIHSLGHELDLRSSLWAYFVMLSLQYLKVGGKIAWVLPGSFLHSNYSHAIREFLSSRFEKIAAFQLKERFFLYEGTHEETIVVLGAGYKKLSSENKDISLIYCPSSKKLKEAVAKWQSETSQQSSCASPVLAFLGKNSRQKYLALTSLQECKNLGDYARVSIGLVTGANKFFVLDKETAISNALSPAKLIPILAKFSSVKGISFNRQCHAADSKSGKRCLLVSSKREKPNKDIAKYLRKFPKEEIGTTSTFKKRKLWFRIHDKKLPDAFFSVMNHTGPRLALNAAKINCTNSVHRVYFKKHTSEATKKLIAISLLSGFSQLSAEIEGRKYGSGVLKHEPREAEKIKILVPKNVKAKVISKKFSQIDTLLKKGKIERASEIADEFIFGLLKTQSSEILKGALKEVRRKRYISRSK